jgi:SAM-dependent methyltransferase
MFRRYATWSSGDVLRHRYIDLVLEQNLITPGARALDLGCGTGALATKYLSEKFEVTGVDISQRSVDAARGELPGARFVVADMATIEFPPRTFELVTAFYSLIHVPRQEHAGATRSSDAFCSVLRERARLRVNSREDQRRACAWSSVVRARVAWNPQHSGGDCKGVPFHAELCLRNGRPDGKQTVNRRSTMRFSATLCSIQVLRPGLHVKLPDLWR